MIVKSIIIIAWVLARGITDCKSNNSDKSIRSFKRVRSTSTSYIIIHKSIRNYNTSSIEFVLEVVIVELLGFFGLVLNMEIVILVEIVVVLVVF